MATPITLAPTVLPGEQEVRLGRRALPLAGASVAYDVVEAIIAISAGLVAGSVAAAPAVGAGWERTC